MSDIFGNCDLELDLQCQIGLQTSKIFISTVKYYIELFRILPSNLNCLSSIYMSQLGLKTGDLDINLHGEIALEA